MKILLNLVNYFLYLILEHKKHYYQVRVEYSKNNIKLFEYEVAIALEFQNEILDKRRLKQRLDFHTLVNSKLSTKKLLNNGNLTLCCVCYLGYFRKPQRMYDYENKILLSQILSGSYSEKYCVT